MTELRYRWWRWCIGDVLYVADDTRSARVIYAISYYLYTAPIHVPITAIVAAFVWWLE